MKHVYRPTDKSHTNCGGKILEQFSKKDPQPENSAAPNQKICTTGFYCEKCGQAFGGPLFKETEILFKIGTELLFELTCIEIFLTRKFNPMEIPFSLGKELVKKASKMDKGDVLYFSYSDKNNSNFNDQSCLAGFVRLEPKGDSPLFTLSKEAFSFQP